MRFLWHKTEHDKIQFSECYIFEKESRTTSFRIFWSSHFKLRHPNVLCHGWKPWKKLRDCFRIFATARSSSTITVAIKKIKNDVRYAVCEVHTSIPEERHLAFQNSAGLPLIIILIPWLFAFAFIAFFIVAKVTVVDPLSVPVEPIPTRGSWSASCQEDCKFYQEPAVHSMLMDTTMSLYTFQWVCSARRFPESTQEFHISWTGLPITSWAISWWPFYIFFYICFVALWESTAIFGSILAYNVLWCLSSHPRWRKNEFRLVKRKYVFRWVYKSSTVALFHKYTATWLDFYFVVSFYTI